MQVSLAICCLMLGFHWSLVNALGSVDEYKKDCIGTDAGNPSHDNNPARRYQQYRKMYTNCTHVLKNLEILFLNGNDTYDLSFLSSIREVNGYVYIVGNHIDYLPLNNLRLIRGRNLRPGKIPSTKQDSTFSLYVALNVKENSTTVGLKQVHLTSLYEIVAGDVIFIDNFLLCYVETILWNDIFIGRSAKVWFESEPNVNIYNKSCQNMCHENCSKLNSTESAHCWGPESDQCQHLNVESCRGNCPGSCFGSGETECCNSQCVGGCNGSLNTDCWACRTFNDNDACVDACPPVTKYNPVTFQNEDNPSAKFAYGSLCIKNCSTVNMLTDNAGCVATCREGYRQQNGYCVKCDGVCDKPCNGTNENSWIDSTNIESFKGCTVIEGSLRIQQTTFTGLKYGKNRITFDQLQVFEFVQRINGYLLVEANFEGFTSLSFFKRLRVITGSRLHESRLSVVIHGTSLEYLGLVSLKEVLAGTVFIRSNPKLCFAHASTWTKITRNRIIISSNRNDSQCSRCSEQCNPNESCWGPDANHCEQCRNYRFQQFCVSECNANYLSTFFNSSVYVNMSLRVNLSSSREKLCIQCNQECIETCSGPGADQCKSCRHYKDGPYCVSQCPITKYPDSNGTCQSCHSNCQPEYGCSGPQSSLGLNGCYRCANLVFDYFNQSKLPSNNSLSTLQPRQCMDKSENNCPEGYYFYRKSMSIETMNGPSVQLVQMCRKCHPECIECNDGSSQCPKCRHFVQDEQCVSHCDANYYIKSQLCLPCHTECSSCFGETQYECSHCKHYRVYVSHDNQSSTDEYYTYNITSDIEQSLCVLECPETHLFEYLKTDKNPPERVCLEAQIDSVVQPDSVDTTVTKYGSIAAVGLVAICFVVVGAIYVKKQNAVIQIHKETLEAQLSGIGDFMLESDNKADMSVLRVINESELRQGEIIGSGAFGTVFKGVWVPPFKRVKVLVAIKVLQIGRSTESDKALLDEARIMASVCHPSCIRIIAVSLAAQIKLITQFMPLGCLLNYVQNNQQNIGSRALLNWSTQIASGMQYLESVGIVHRDLAARNILLKSSLEIKITDFGLAKLLHNDNFVLSAGGKMPIKWLALESIQNRLFTHKTDVWSFGVTLWEIFTYGQHPYESVPALELAQVLEKGERLMQPPICTIDVYMLMIKCWMVDADSRPSFAELHSEFSKMSKDPGRYLVIQGDKLMRLPSHVADTEQLLSEMSLACGDDFALDAEAILNAEDYLDPQSVQQTTNHHLSQDYENVTDIDSCMKPMFERELSQRYCADPCHDVTDYKYKMYSVDETNYLEPKSINKPNKYIDVIGDNDTPHGYLDMTSSPVPLLSQPFIADNPEYFS